MPLLPIVKEGHSVLRKKTEAVLQIDPSIQELIEDMYKTMYAAPKLSSLN
jgi:peptide deformylase